jgi:hypothetical protein
VISSRRNPFHARRVILILAVDPHRPPPYVSDMSRFAAYPK